MINKVEITSHIIKEIEEYLKKENLLLNEISYCVNGFAIAEVAEILESSDLDIFTPPVFTVIIDVQKIQCCEFEFYGYETDGIRILRKPKKSKFPICCEWFTMEFIETIDGKPTPYILISHLDFLVDTNSIERNFIRTCIFNFSNPHDNFNNSYTFKFENCLVCDKSVEVNLIDIDNPILFAYKLNPRECMSNFDGLWNTSLYCTNKRIIPLFDDEDFGDAVNSICSEIEDEIAEDYEERKQLRDDEISWKIEQDMLEYDNRCFGEMLDEYEAWGNLD